MVRSTQKQENVLAVTTSSASSSAASLCQTDSRYLKEQIVPEKDKENGTIPIMGSGSNDVGSKCRRVR